MSKIIFSTFPKTVKPKDFSIKVVEVFQNHFEEISTVNLTRWPLQTSAKP